MAPTDLAVSMTARSLDRQTEGLRCSICDIALVPGTYFMCDQDEGEFCPGCFKGEHPCGKGEHGESCATAVLDDGQDRVNP